MADKELPTIRVLHTGDVHLNGDPARQADFARVIDLAIAERIDAVVIAGDLFDHSRVEPDVVASTLEVLGKLACPTVVIAGNHDCLDALSLYHRFDLEDAGAHVHFLGSARGEWIRLGELNLAIWGRGIEDHDPKFHPLEDFTLEHEDCWRVVVAHGFFVPAGEATYRSSPITEEEIAALDCDYLALGHWHRFLDVSAGNVKAYYSGSPTVDVTDFASVNVIELDATNGSRVERVAIGSGTP